jgi:histone H1/5
MSVEAIKALKDRTGSSSAAIKKYIIANNTGLVFLQHALKLALKTGVANGTLIPVKGSFKLSVRNRARKFILFLNPPTPFSANNPW